MCMTLYSCYRLNFSTISYTDPDFNTPMYEKLAIMGDFNDPFLITNFEREFVIVARKEGLICNNATPIFPPTREWSDEVIYSTLQREGYDALIVVSLVDNYIVREQVPGTQEIRTTKTVKEDNNKKRDDKDEKESEDSKEITEITTVTNQPPRIIETEFTYIQFRILDVKTGKLAHISTAGRSDGGINMSDFRRDYYMNQISLDQILKLKRASIIKSINPRTK